MQTNGAAFAFDDKGGSAAETGREVEKRPAFCFVWVGARCEDLGLSGRERYVETVQRQRHSLPLRFDVGFFARPTGEEGRGAITAGHEA